MNSAAILSQGKKDDSSKVQVELLSPLWLLGVGRILTRGATKYSAHNWRKGLERARTVGASLRHIFAYLAGEDNDSETGESHLLHASCELMFSYELSLTHPQTDNRFKLPAEIIKKEFQLPDQTKKGIPNV